MRSPIRIGVELENGRHVMGGFSSMNFMGRSLALRVTWHLVRCAARPRSPKAKSDFLGLKSMPANGPKFWFCVLGIAATTMKNILL